MVRAFREAEIDRAAEIWLDTNVKAHAFISLQYWREHFEEVRGMLRQAELYVYEDESLHTVQGFIGLEGDYVAGIFVADGAQSGGIGSQLLDYVKALRPRISLPLTQKNTRALACYG